MIDDADIATRRYCALMIVGIALPFLLSPFLSYIFLSANQSFVYRLVVSRIIIWAELGILFLYARQAEVQKFLLLKEEEYGIGFYFTSVVSLYLAGWGAGIVAHIPDRLGLHQNNDMMRKMMGVMRQYPVLIPVTAITAGITEEFIFRGYMLSRLWMFIRNKHLAIVISALLFAAVHLGYKNLGELIFAFLFGVIFAYHYQKYQNIKVLMIAHALWDLAASSIILYHR
jgi:membrane protease YdiL (CAAX protease family)